MPADKRTDDRRVDTYHVGDTADSPRDGHLWVDSSNTNRIVVFRNGSWVTPRFDGITLTGTTTVTTLTATTVNPSDATVASTLVAQRIRVAGVASLATGQITTLTSLDGTVASTLTAQRTQVAGVASLADAQVVALTIPTPAASATGRVVLGNSAVPTTATSTSGFVQLAALPGTPVGQSAVPATDTVFLTFDTAKRQLAINIAGTWYTAGASMERY